MVRIARQKIICFILAVIILGSGMGLEIEKAHSSLASLRDSVSFICNTGFTEAASVFNGAGLAVDTTIESVPLCNSEMLGIRNRTGLQEFPGRYINQKRESCLSLVFVCTDLIASLEEKFSYSLDGIPSLVKESEKLVIQYIHQSDGKKKI